MLNHKNKKNAKFMFLRRRRVKKHCGLGMLLGGIGIVSGLAPMAVVSNVFASPEELEAQRMQNVREAVDYLSDVEVDYDEGGVVLREEKIPLSKAIAVTDTELKNADGEMTGILYKENIADVIELTDGRVLLKSNDFEGYADPKMFLFNEEAFDYLNAKEIAVTLPDGLQDFELVSINDKEVIVNKDGRDIKYDINTCKVDYKLNTGKSKSTLEKEAEEKHKAEEEAKRKAEEERKRQEEEARKKEEEERKAKEKEEARRKAEEEAKKAAPEIQTNMAGVYEEEATGGGVSESSENYDTSGWKTGIASAYGGWSDASIPSNARTATGDSVTESSMGVAVPMAWSGFRSLYGHKVLIEWNGQVVEAVINDCGGMGGGSRSLDLQPGVFRAFGFDNCYDWGLKEVRYQIL